MPVTERASARRTTAILALILGLQIVVRIAIIGHAGAMTDQGLYGDDSFIIHKLAADIAAGKGITQAGEPTNGFQPLFIFLLVPLFWVFDIYHATVASAVINGVLSTAGSLFVFLILAELCRPRVALIGAALWAMSAHLTRVSLNGMETPLANLMMLCSVYGYLRVNRRDAQDSVTKGAIFGSVLGLALLSRFDLGLLLVPLAVDFAIRCALRGRYKSLTATMAAGVVVVLPWFVWNWSVCGSIVPISGAASRTISQLYGSATGPSQMPEYFPLGSVPAEFYRDSVASALERVVTDSPIAIPAVGLVGNNLWVVSAWMLGIVALSWLCSRGDGELSLRYGLVLLGRKLWFLWLFIPVLVAAYGLYFFAQWHYWRYMTPAVIALILPSALCINRLWAWAYRGSTWRMLPLIVLGVGFTAISVRDHARLFAAPDPNGIAYRIYHDAIKLRDLAASGVRIGSFESGTPDYFIEADIFNLDGKTNALAHREMVEGRMDRLVETMKLDYVVSSPPLIRDLLSNRGQWRPGQLEIVGKLSHNWIVKIHRDPSSGRSD